MAGKNCAQCSGGNDVYTQCALTCCDQCGGKNSAYSQCVDSPPNWYDRFDKPCFEYEEDVDRCQNLGSAFYAKHNDFGTLAGQVSKYKFVFYCY